MANAPRRWWTEEEDRILRHECELQAKNGQTADWTAIAAKLPERSNKDCRKRWSKISGDRNKGAWNEAEDDKLRRAIAKFGCRWTIVAREVNSRNPDQCSKRWLRLVDLGLDRGNWSAQDDQRLIAAVRKYGPNWKTIAEDVFPRQSAMTVKNRYSHIQNNIASTQKQLAAAIASSASMTNGHTETSLSPHNTRAPSFPDSRHASDASMHTDAMPMNGQPELHAMADLQNGFDVTTMQHPGMMSLHGFPQGPTDADPTLHAAMTHDFTGTQMDWTTGGLPDGHPNDPTIQSLAALPSVEFDFNNLGPPPDDTTPFTHDPTQFTDPSIHVRPQPERVLSRESIISMPMNSGPNTATVGSVHEWPDPTTQSDTISQRSPSSSPTPSPQSPCLSDDTSKQDLKHTLLLEDVPPDLVEKVLSVLITSDANFKMQLSADNRS